MNSKLSKTCLLLLLWVLYSCFFTPPFQSTHAQENRLQMRNEENTIVKRKELHSIAKKKNSRVKKEAQLLLHKYIETPYKCEFCGWKCTSSNELHQHQFEYH